MRTFPRQLLRNTLTALLVASTLLAPAISAQTTAPVRASRVNQAIQLQREAKHQLQELIQIMHQISSQLEKTDPATARAIATAAARAEEAFIADDMEKVIRLLQSGLIVPADATQAKIVEALRQVLETLRSGGDDLLARLIELEKMLAMMDALNTVLTQQRDLERRSRVLAFPGAADARLDETRQKVAAVVAAQQGLLTRTKTMSVDALARQLSAADTALYDLLKRADLLIRSAADPFPAPELMESNTAASRALATEVITVRVSLKTMLNDKAIAAPIAAAKATDDAAGVEAALGKMVEELEKAAKNLQADDLEKGQVGIAEAKAQAKAAIAALEKTMSKLPGAKDAVSVLTEQQAVLDQAAALGPILDDVAPVYEKKVGPALHRNTSAAPPTTAPATQATTQPAFDTTPPVLVALRRFDKDTALVEQERLLEFYGLWSKRMAAALESNAALRKNPDYPAQRAQQDGIAATITRLAQGQVLPSMTRPASATEPATKPAPPTFLSGELQVQMNNAAGHASTAAGHLGAQKPADANKEQKEVIRLLELVIARMQSDFEGFAAEFAKDFQEMVQADLERIVLAQKRCTADTLAIWEKRQPDGSFKRTEVLAMAAVGKAEGEIPPIMDHMLHLMATNKSAHAIVQFPPICYLLLNLARTDIEAVQRRLADNSDAGPGTQRMQKDIEERLEGIKKALAAKDSKASPPPQWGQNQWGQPESSRVDRIAEVQMMMVLQAQINRRTQEIDALKTAGKTPAAELERQQREITKLQDSVRDFVEKVIEDDESATIKSGHK